MSAGRRTPQSSEQFQRFLSLQEIQLYNCDQINNGALHIVVILTKARPHNVMHLTFVSSISLRGRAGSHVLSRSRCYYVDIGGAFTVLVALLLALFRHCKICLGYLSCNSKVTSYACSCRNNERCFESA